MVQEDKKTKVKLALYNLTSLTFTCLYLKKILIDSINYAKEYIDITKEQFDIILACRKAVLENNGTTWIKSGPINFDVPMGGYDSSQIADLVGRYILHVLNRIINSDHIGLYRDDGLIYIPNSNGPNSSSIQKKIIRAFKPLGFKIEISSNNKIVNFLDVTLDLSNNIYKPFIKMDQSPSCINVNSNHPKAIIKQVPKAVNLRIRNLSANEEIFRKGSKMYIDALKSSRYKENFTYKEEKVPNGNHHHHIALVAQISLTLSRHSSLSFITLGRSSGQHPVSSHSCCMYVRAGRPAFCVGVHKSTSLMSSSLLLQQCPACLVCLT